MAFLNKILYIFIFIIIIFSASAVVQLKPNICLFGQDCTYNNLIVLGNLTVNGNTTNNIVINNITTNTYNVTGNINVSNGCIHFDDGSSICGDVYNVTNNLTVNGNLNINNNNITNIYSMQFNYSICTDTDSAKRRSMCWNPDQDTLNIIRWNGQVYQVGKEMGDDGINKDTVTLYDGNVVCMNGFQGDNPTFVRGNGSNISQSAFCGILTSGEERGQPCGVNDLCAVTVFGFVNNLDTSSYTTGMKLYLDPDILGNLTQVKPELPNNPTWFATVGRVDSNVGTIFVNPRIDMSDGLLANNLWVNENITFLGNIIGNGSLIYDLNLTGIASSLQDAYDNGQEIIVNNNTGVLKFNLDGTPRGENFEIWLDREGYGEFLVNEEGGFNLFKIIENGTIERRKIVSVTHIPFLNNTYDIGSTDRYWRSGYFQTQIYSSILNASTKICLSGDCITSWQDVNSTVSGGSGIITFDVQNTSKFNSQGITMSLIPV